MYFFSFKWKKVGLNHHSLEELILLKEIWRICQWLLCSPIYVICFLNVARLESAITSKTIIKSLKLAMNQYAHINIQEWLWNYNVNPILGMLWQDIYLPLLRTVFKPQILIIVPVQFNSYIEQLPQLFNGLNIACGCQARLQFDAWLQEIWCKGWQC